MRIQKVLSVLLSIALFFAGLLIIFNLQSIYDWYRLRGYDPPAEITALADATTMSPYGEKLFYVNRPALKGKTTFRESCTTNEASIVLGCYVSNRGIYIYDVEDPRLKGIEEVTAAHEMLHVGYERLSSDERARVDRLTDQAFKELDNERIKQTVEQYRADDPSVVPNELHSILGTEVRDLPAELEAHYRQFFEDRSKVVTLAERYERVFTERERQIAEYDRKLASLESDINSTRQQIDALNEDLQRQRAQLDTYYASNNISTYNAGVGSYNAAVREYNALIEAAQADIRQFNDMVKARNKIALEERDLYQALDSRVLQEE